MLSCAVFSEGRIVAIWFIFLNINFEIDVLKLLLFRKNITAHESGRSYNIIYFYQISIGLFLALNFHSVLISLALSKALTVEKQLLVVHINGGFRRIKHYF